MNLLQLRLYLHTFIHPIQDPYRETDPTTWRLGSKAFWNLSVSPHGPSFLHFTSLNQQHYVDNDKFYQLKLWPISLGLKLQWLCVSLQINLGNTTPISPTQTMCLWLRSYLCSGTLLSNKMFITELACLHHEALHGYVVFKISW